MSSIELREKSRGWVVVCSRDVDGMSLRAELILNTMQCCNVSGCGQLNYAKFLGCNYM
jgi:hypothetical protein